MANQFISIGMKEGVATITLNRPEKRNAMHQGLIQECIQTLNEFSEDPKVRVLLISGNGEHFCAGADIHAMQAIARSDFADNLADAEQLAKMIYQLYSFPKPTIALAQGATLGGGLGILAACDMVIAATEATFGFSEVKIGITPSIVSPYVIAAIGARAAQYYFLTGDRFSAEEAHQLGLVQQLCDSRELHNAGRALAQRLLGNSNAALVEAKQLIRRIVNKEITPQLAQQTAEHLARMRKTSDAEEGLKAFIEKREPSWRV